MPDAPDPPPPPPRARPLPIPLTVLAGPREGGRAALTARLLADPALAGAWLVPDEAEAGEGEGEGDDGRSAAGCPCCTGRGALVGALEGLLRDLDNGRRPRPPRALVEAGAAADPVAVLAAVWLHPYLSRRFAPAEALAVLDAADPAALDAPLARARLTAARAAVLHRAADADPAALAALRERAAALNPLAVLLDADAPPAALLAAADGDAPAEPG